MVLSMSFDPACQLLALIDQPRTLNIDQSAGWPADGVSSQRCYLMDSERDPGILGVY